MFAFSVPLQIEMFPPQEDQGDIEPSTNIFFDGNTSVIWFKDSENEGVWLSVLVNVKPVSFIKNNVLSFRSFSHISRMSVGIDDPRSVISKDLFEYLGFDDEDTEQKGIPLLQIIHSPLLNPASLKVFKKFCDENKNLVSLESSSQAISKGGFRGKDVSMALGVLGPMIEPHQNVRKYLPLKANQSPRNLLDLVDTTLAYSTMRFLGLRDGDASSEKLTFDQFPLDQPAIGFEEGRFTQEEKNAILVANYSTPDNGLEPATQIIGSRTIEMPPSFFTDSNKKALSFRDNLVNRLNPESEETIRVIEDIELEPDKNSESEKQPGSIKALRSALSAIQDEAKRIGSLDFGDLETSEKDLKKIEHLGLRIKSLEKQNTDLESGRKSLNLEIEKLRKEARDSVEIANANLSRMREEHNIELLAKEEENEKSTIRLNEEVEGLTEIVDKLKRHNEGLRQAANVSFSDSYLEEIQLFLDKKAEEASEATEISTFLEDEIEQILSKVARLEAKLDWYRRTNAEASVIEQTENIGENEKVDITSISKAFKNNGDLFNYAKENLAYISISSDTLSAIKHLDGFERSKSWAKKALYTLLSMNEYAEGIQNGTISSSFIDYASSHESKYQIPRFKIAMESAKSKVKSSSYRRTRRFRVDESEEWVGEREIECYPHIRVATELPGPRIYFTDETISTNGKIFVGYYGEHLPNLTPANVS